MRRLVLLLVLASAVFLSGCGGISVTYKETPAASATGALEHPSDDAAAPSASPNPSPSVSPSAGEAPAVSTTPASTGAGTPAPSSEKPVPVSAAPTPEVSPSPTPDTTPSPTPEANSQPPLLTKKLQAMGLSFDDITYSQLILVAASGSKADLYCYEKDTNGVWKLSAEIGYLKGYVGKNGVSPDKREGDSRTPAGLFSLGFAFGNSPKPETGLTWRAVTAASYWVDDPSSLYYNQWVEGTDNADWTSAEHLSESTKSYAYAVVVDYNMAPDTLAGKGSAIFLHCKTEPTSGCIAAPQVSILKILKWLSEEKNPGILITGG